MNNMIYKASAEHAEVVESKLTDRSLVYEIRINSGYGNIYTIPCVTKRGAQAIADALNSTEGMI